MADKMIRGVRLLECIFKQTFMEGASVKTLSLASSTLDVLGVARASKFLR